MSRHRDNNAQAALVAAFGRRVYGCIKDLEKREGKNISNAEVARRIQASGVDALSRAAVSRWIHGHSTPNLATVEATAKLFGVSPGWLAFGQLPRDAKAAQFNEGDGTPDGVPRAAAVVKKFRHAPSQSQKAKG